MVGQPPRRSFFKFQFPQNYDHWENQEGRQNYDPYRKIPSSFFFKRGAGAAKHCFSEPPTSPKNFIYFSHFQVFFRKIMVGHVVPQEPNEHLFHPICPSKWWQSYKNVKFSIKNEEYFVKKSSKPSNSGIICYLTASFPSILRPDTWSIPEKLKSPRSFD